MGRRLHWRWGQNQKTGTVAQVGGRTPAKLNRAGFRASAGVLPHRRERRSSAQYTGPLTARQPTSNP